MNGRIDISFGPPSSEPLTAAVPPALVDPLRRHATFQALRAAVLVCGTVLVVRAVFVEPFGVPTGSMAPTLVGVHRSTDCAHCGMHVVVGAPNETSEKARHYAKACCPNCGQPLGLDAAADASGDRVLVDKMAFEWRVPRRWEPIVFRRPGDSDKPLVKRVVGLPGERVRIHDGDVLVNGDVSRKPLAFCRSMQVPVLNLTHVPPEGWSSQWRADPADAPDRTPWVDGGDLVFPVEAAKSLRWLVFDRGEPFRDGCVYNAGEAEQGSAVHDFRMTCDVVVHRGEGEVAFSLTDGADEAIARLPLGDSGRATVSVAGLSREARGVRLRPGRRTRIELAFIDRRVSLAVDGEEVLLPLELPLMSSRAAVRRPMKVGARGVSATIIGLRLGRDIHYASAETHGVVDECTLAPNEYYVLGDNSANSEDSRYWPTPGVSAAAFVGKPFWIHQPARGASGFDWSRFGPIR